MAQVIGIGKQEINKITGAVKPAAPIPTTEKVVVKNTITLDGEKVAEKVLELSKEEKPKRGRKKKTEEV